MKSRPRVELPEGWVFADLRLVLELFVDAYAEFVGATGAPSRRIEIVRTQHQRGIALAIREGRAVVRNFDGSRATPLVQPELYVQAALTNGVRYMGYISAADVAAYANDCDYEVVRTAMTKDSGPVEVEAQHQSFIADARKCADEEALKRWNRGEREITARKIAPKVAARFEESRAHFGRRGARSVNNVRSVALKGWKFVPPSAPTNSHGSNGSDGSKATNEPPRKESQRKRRKL